LDRLEIAGVGIALELEEVEPVLMRRIAGAYGRFIRPGGPVQFRFHVRGGAARVEIAPPRVTYSDGAVVLEEAEEFGELDPISGVARIATDRALLGLDAFLRAAVSLGVERRGGCLFHAAAVVVDGLAYLFPGHSGAGKSTLASLAQTPLSDEICAVTPVRDGLIAHATPWWRGQASCAPLAGVFSLSWQGEGLSFRPPGAALRHLLANLVIMLDGAESRKATFAAAGRIAASVPFGQLAFGRETDIDLLLRRCRRAA